MVAILRILPTFFLSSSLDFSAQTWAFIDVETRSPTRLTNKKYSFYSIIVRINYPHLNDKYHCS